MIDLSRHTARSLLGAALVCALLLPAAGLMPAMGGMGCHCAVGAHSCGQGGLLCACCRQQETAMLKCDGPGYNSCQIAPPTLSAYQAPAIAEPVYALTVVPRPRSVVAHRLDSPSEGFHALPVKPPESA